MAMYQETDGTGAVVELKPLREGAKNEDEDSLSMSSHSGRDSGQSTPVRETWARKLDFMLSLLGFCVGLGNLWRFPYLCMRNGGGSFLIPFLFCLVMLGIPLHYLEMSLGQFTGKGALHCWNACPLFKGIGAGMVLFNTIVSLYYNVIIAWTLFYLANSFLPQMPWSTCQGWWNTPHCQVQGRAHDVNVTASNAPQPGYQTSVNSTSPVRTSEEEFLQFNMLQMSSGLHEVGTIPWYLAVSFFCAWVFVFLCVMKGVRSIGKVVYVTAIMPYVLLTILLVKGATLPGAVDGIVYYLKPDLARLMRIQVWVEAALQVCYSLGFCYGPLITMASYNRFNDNCLRNSLLISFAGECTSVFSGFVVFTILGFVAHDLGVPIESVVKSGPGLGFVAYPQALARLPVPQLWAVLFFFMLFTVGLDSQFASVEVVQAALLDTFPNLRRRQVLITAVMCMVFFLLGLPLITQGGIYIFQLVDWYVVSMAIPCFGLSECIIFGWIYGAERFSRDIELMCGRGVHVIIRVCWCLVTPILLIVCLAFTFVTYKPPSYGTYQYPPYAQVIGWTLALLPVVPIFIVAGYQLYRHKGSLQQRLRQSLKPSRDWAPAPEQYKYSYETFNYNGYSLGQRVKANLFGYRA